MLEDSLSKNWWFMLLRGILALLFGFFVLTQPAISLAALVFSFAAFTLLEGVLGTLSALRLRHLAYDWWVLLLEGLLAILIAVISFTSPLVTAVVLLLYMATWAIITGAFRVLTAIRLRHEIKGELWMIAGGVVSIAFGVLVMRFPGAGALAVLSYIGFWALLTGASLVLSSLRMRSLAKELEGTPGARQVQAPAH